MTSNQNMTPAEIVNSLDQYIIGQNEAKKSVAVALRNRYRRLLLDEDMQKEITPKNILMIGPTGVGKTEIARRLANIVKAPFVKVEATKFTEVGYVGRDVESMVRDLVENAIQIVRDEKKEAVKSEARSKAVDRVAAALVPGERKEKARPHNPFDQMMRQMGMDPDQFQAEDQYEEEVTTEVASKRSERRQQINQGLLDDAEVTLKVVEKPTTPNTPMNAQFEQMGIDLSDAFKGLGPEKKIERTMTVKEAVDYLTDEEADQLINEHDIQQEALELAANSGIIFIDEIDKITSDDSRQSGTVSREGVQRDILPIVEGSSVRTKYGHIQTDHILFIGSGAFHVSSPSDLIPELQGRFPIRVELNDLSQEDFFRILTEPNNALIKQYKALLATENIEVTFTHEAVERISEMAYQINNETDNIGARRLHTILEKLLEDLLFEAPEMQMGEVTITRQYVDEKLSDIVEDRDLSRYIL